MPQEMFSSHFGAREVLSGIYLQIVSDTSQNESIMENSCAIRRREIQEHMFLIGMPIGKSKNFLLVC